MADVTDEIAAAFVGTCDAEGLNCDELTLGVVWDWHTQQWLSMCVDHLAAYCPDYRAAAARGDA